MTDPLSDVRGAPYTPRIPAGTGRQPCFWLAIRRLISSGETSSMCVAIDQ
jgi:hypothetical protein